MFEQENARRRLEAVGKARQLLQEAAEVLQDADVKNTRVAKAMAMCRKELTDYQHVTSYSIRKREDRANDQSTRKKRPNEVEEEEQGAGLAGVPSEEGSVLAGLCGQAQEA